MYKQGPALFFCLPKLEPPVSQAKARTICSCGPGLSPFVPAGKGPAPLFLRPRSRPSVPVDKGHNPLVLQARARPSLIAVQDLNELFLLAKARSLCSGGQWLEPSVSAGQDWNPLFLWRNMDGTLCSYRPEPSVTVDQCQDALILKTRAGPLLFRVNVGTLCS